MKEKYWALLAVLLMAAGGVELYLLERGPEKQESLTPSEYFPHLKPGEKVPAFDADRFGGGKERLDYPSTGGKTLVFVMSLTCGSCLKTMPHWNRIASETRGQTRTVGVVIGKYENEDELLKEKELGFPVYRFPDEKMQLVYKVSRVPQTLLIGPGGKVEQAIVGELSDAQIADLIGRAKTAGSGGTD